MINNQKPTKKKYYATGTGRIHQLPCDGGWKVSMLGESTLTIISSSTDSSLELSSSAMALRCRRGGKGAMAGAAGADFLFIRLEPSDCTDSRGRELDIALEGTFG
jgi:hypothetical protein